MHHFSNNVKLSTANPWDLQKQFMHMSDQKVHNTPTLDGIGLLYTALMTEELGEHLAAVASVLGNSADTIRLHHKLSRMAGDLHIFSVQLREHIAAPGGIKPVSLNIGEAAEILDALSDLSVVNFGACAAMGLPGKLGYEEVQASNASKANPSTGKIDKTADGKWIKGTSYRPPNLRSIVSARAPDELGYPGAWW